MIASHIVIGLTDSAVTAGWQAVSPSCNRAWRFGHITPARRRDEVADGRPVLLILSAFPFILPQIAGISGGSSISGPFVDDVTAWNGKKTDVQNALPIDECGLANLCDCMSLINANL